jgi:hypothetical protein
MPSKYISHSSMIEYETDLWLVNSTKNGIYTKQMKSILKELYAMRSHYPRLHVIVLQLSIDSYTPTNEAITRFNYDLFRYIRFNYGTKNIGFVWVREIERVKKQHYHYALILDGKVIQQPSALLKKAEECWANVGYLSRPKNCFYNLTDNDTDTLQQVIYRLSYFAKGRCKGGRPPQTKDFNSSRIKPKQLQHSI